MGGVRGASRASPWRLSGQRLCLSQRASELEGFATNEARGRGGIDSRARAAETTIDLGSCHRGHGRRGALGHSLWPRAKPSSHQSRKLPKTVFARNWFGRKPGDSALKAPRLLTASSSPTSIGLTKGIWRYEISKQEKTAGSLTPRMAIRDLTTTTPTRAIPASHRMASRSSIPGLFTRDRASRPASCVCYRWTTPQRNRTPFGALRKARGPLFSTGFLTAVGLQQSSPSPPQIIKSSLFL